MKLENAKELKNILKSKEQASAVENIKLVYKSQQAVIKVFNEYFSIASETKQKVKYGKRTKILGLK